MTLPLDLLTELEPTVARLLDRHVAAAPVWFPHAYIPWSRAADFDGPLNGTPWRADQSELPQAVADALMVNLLTEDNLPSYHFEIATQFGRDGAWGAWVHRWTAEEDRHAHALRGYLHARRAVDPVALERQRMQHVSLGYSSDHASLLHGLAYVTVQELATREAHRNTGLACADPVARQLTARIAADENLHMIFYRDLYTAAVELDPDSALSALADVICSFDMPGSTIPGFQQRALRIAASGIYNLDVHRRHVLQPLLRSLGVMTRSGLGPAGEQARDRIGRQLDELRTKAERSQRLFDRMRETAPAAFVPSPHPPLSYEERPGP
ncbi:acyl-ACP desaturase [Streptomyces sp. DK15]|uniref:acyl-ACP desaturase n=1 Tax=Streptomyces sp. DK15 TaxID=2957499 RepID=UPI0029ACABFB|nr:acyl-ACP desaturase [Streptomyces sp. DK15]MDX2393599.1 acyl-ACP desaturase [Streptomyces sp. DK15]